MNNPDREAGRIKSKSAGRGNQRLPGASLLDLQERRRELIQCENQPVAVTSPYGLPAIPVEAHGDDGGPGFDTRDFYLRGLPESLAEPPRSCNGWKLASAARFPRRLHVVPQNRAVWAVGSVIKQIIGLIPMYHPRRFNGPRRARPLGQGCPHPKRRETRRRATAETKEPVANAGSERAE